MRNPAGKIVRDAKRRGGPMDTVDVTTRCLRCGLLVTHPLRWFQRKKQTCTSCGGALDQKPLTDVTVAAAEQFLQSLENFQRSRGIQ